MQKLSNTNSKTKKGMASFYVVIFTTLILSVIVVSFVRIIVSETSQTSNNDLSQSAYDAALAGVEDAKSALLKCLNSNNSDIESCAELFGGSCNLVSKYLNRTFDANSAVPIQTSSNGQNTEEQAYTCVTIDNTLSDYRTTHTSENRTRVANLSSSNAQPDKVRISWYSKDLPESSSGTDTATTFPNADEAPTPPVIVAQIIQANGDFTPTALGSDLGDGVGQGTLVLYPQVIDSSDGEPDRTIINAATLANSGNDESTNAPILVSCSNDNLSSGFACSAIIELPASASGLLYAHLSLPYGTEDTELSLELLDSNNNVIEIKNAQFSVDSTGRANDLYRRVETRIELGNQYFPTPEYVVQLFGDDSSSFNKNFYVTTNCWTADNGKAESCANYGEV